MELNEKQKKRLFPIGEELFWCIQLKKNRGCVDTCLGGAANQKKHPVFGSAFWFIRLGGGITAV